jgi:hypothetical protein
MFFLGAGASVPAGLKDVISAVPDFEEWLKNRDSVCPGCSKAIGQIISIMKNWSVDIETLLEIVERLEGSFKDIIPNFFKDKTIKLDESSVELLKNGRLSDEVKTFVQITYQDFKTSEYYKPLKKFLLNYKPLLIFSTNYDLVIEDYCDSHTPRVRHTDFLTGDEWNTQLSDPNEFGVILHKLHGSVNWARTESGKVVKLPEKNKSGKIELFGGEKAVPLLLYPGKKLDYIEQTLDLLQLLKMALTEVKCCFVVGYKFGDEHIAKLFRYSGYRNEDLIVFVISPSAHSIYFDKLKRHRDDAFRHSFMHEDFTSDSFNTTVPTNLEGRVICLPYRFQLIFPSLLHYYDELRKGLLFDSIIGEKSSTIDPLTGHIYGHNTFNLIDCLNCYKECEHFDRIDRIVEERKDGWDSIISRAAEVDHFRYRLLDIYDILLKRYFNYYNSNNRDSSLNLLMEYLRVKLENLSVEAKDYAVNLKFKVADTVIDGSFGYSIFVHLLDKFYIYSKIAENTATEVLDIINKGKTFFEKWKKGTINLKDYLERFTIHDSAENADITGHMDQLGTGTPEDAKEHNRLIAQIVLGIEQMHL